MPPGKELNMTNKFREWAAVVESACEELKSGNEIDPCRRMLLFMALENIQEKLEKEAIAKDQTDDKIRKCLSR